MKIIPGKGINLVGFGLNESEALEKLGQPDKVFFTDCDCKRLQFYKHKIELSFEPENENRLGWIEVHNQDYTLFGRNLFQESQDAIILFLNDMLKETPEIEDFDSFISVSYDNNWIELQFKFGELTNINLGMIYDKNNKPKWPNT